MSSTQSRDVVNSDESTPYDVKSFGHRLVAVSDTYDVTYGDDGVEKLRADSDMDEEAHKAAIPGGEVRGKGSPKNSLRHSESLSAANSDDPDNGYDGEDQNEKEESDDEIKRNGKINFTKAKPYDTRHDGETGNSDGELSDNSERSNDRDSENKDSDNSGAGSDSDDDNNSDTSERQGGYDLWVDSQTAAEFKQHLTNSEPTNTNKNNSLLDPGDDVFNDSDCTGSDLTKAEDSVRRTVDKYDAARSSISADCNFMPGAEDSWAKDSENSMHYVTSSTVVMSDSRFDSNSPASEIISERGSIHSGTKVIISNSKIDPSSEVPVLYKNENNSNKISSAVDDLYDLAFGSAYPDHSHLPRHFEEFVEATGFSCSAEDVTNIDARRETESDKCDTITTSDSQLCERRKSQSAERPETSVLSPTSRKVLIRKSSAQQDDIGHSGTSEPSRPASQVDRSELTMVESSKRTIINVSASNSEDKSEDVVIRKSDTVGGDSLTPVRLNIDSDNVEIRNARRNAGDSRDFLFEQSTHSKITGELEEDFNQTSSHVLHRENEHNIDEVDNNFDHDGVINDDNLVCDDNISSRSKIENSNLGPNADLDDKGLIETSQNNKYNFDDNASNNSVISRPVVEVTLYEKTELITASVVRVRNSSRSDSDNKVDEKNSKGTVDECISLENKADNTTHDNAYGTSDKLKEIVQHNGEDSNDAVSESDDEHDVHFDDERKPLEHSEKLNEKQFEKEEGDKHIDSRRNESDTNINGEQVNEQASRCDEISERGDGHDIEKEGAAETIGNSNDIFSDQSLCGALEFEKDCRREEELKKFDPQQNNTQTNSLNAEDIEVNQIKMAGDMPRHGNLEKTRSSGESKSEAESVIEKQVFRPTNDDEEKLAAKIVDLNELVKQSGDDEDESDREEEAEDNNINKNQQFDKYDRENIDTEMPNLNDADNESGQEAEHFEKGRVNDSEISTLSSHNLADENKMETSSDKSANTERELMHLNDIQLIDKNKEREDDGNKEIQDERDEEEKEQKIEHEEEQLEIENVEENEENIPFRSELPAIHGRDERDETRISYIESLEKPRTATPPPDYSSDSNDDNDETVENRTAVVSLDNLTGESSLPASENKSEDEHFFETQSRARDHSSDETLNTVTNTEMPDVENTSGRVPESSGHVPESSGHVPESSVRTEQVESVPVAGRHQALDRVQVESADDEPASDDDAIFKNSTPLQRRGSIRVKGNRRRVNFTGAQFSKLVENDAESTQDVDDHDASRTTMSASATVFPGSGTSRFRTRDPLHDIGNDTKDFSSDGGPKKKKTELTRSSSLGLFSSDKLGTLRQQPKSGEKVKEKSEAHPERSPFNVILHRSEMGYGFTVNGGNPAHISYVKINSVASRSGVQPGDVLLKVNGTLVEHHSHEDIVKAIQSGKERVNLSLLRYSASGDSDKISAPQAADAEKNREALQEKIITLRNMLEKAQKELEILKTEYSRTQSEAIHQKYENQVLLVRRIQDQLLSLDTSKLGYGGSAAGATQSSQIQQGSSPNYAQHNRSQSAAVNMKAMPEMPLLSERKSMSSMPRNSNDIIGMDDSDVDDDIEATGVTESHIFNDLSKLLRSPAHLSVFLQYLFANGDPAPLLFILVTDYYHLGSLKHLNRWAYEIYSTFLMNDAPLKVTIESTYLQKMREAFEDGVRLLEDPSKSPRVTSGLKEVEMKNLFQLSRFIVRQGLHLDLETFQKFRSLGLGNIYGDQTLHDNMERSAEMKVVDENLWKYFEQFHDEPKDRSQAIAYSLGTYFKQIGFEKNSPMLNYCPVFASGDQKPYRGKQKKNLAVKGHNFYLHQFQLLTHCHNCTRALWGVAYQGYRCDGCSVSAHRHCAESVSEPCVAGTLKRGSAQRDAKRPASRPISGIIGTKSAKEDDATNSIFHFPNPALLDDDTKHVGSDAESKARSPPYSATSTLYESNAPQPSPTYPQVRLNQPPKRPPLHPQWRQSEVDSDPDVPPELPPLSTVISKSVLSGLKKNERKRQEVINELIYTERAHMQNVLLVLDRKFLKPMRTETWIDRSLINLLFPNLDQVICVHSYLNRELRSLRNSTAVVGRVGHVLLKWFSGENGRRFREACANFGKDQQYALDCLRNRLRKDQRLAAFLLDVSMDPVCRKNELKDFLPRVIARLTKYPLLIEQLIKCTPENTEEHENLKKAWKCTRDLLDFVNQAAKEFQNSHKMEELQIKLDKKSVADSCSTVPKMAEYKDLNLKNHTMLYGGDLKWHLNKTKPVNVHMILCTDMIIILHQQDDRLLLRCPTAYRYGKTDEKVTFRPILKLIDLMVQPNRTAQNQFFLVSSSTAKNEALLYDLIASNVEERNKWINHITEAISRYKSQYSTNGSKSKVTPAVASNNIISVNRPEENSVSSAKRQRPMDTTDLSPDSRALLVDASTEVPQRQHRTLAAPSPSTHEPLRETKSADNTGSGLRRKSSQLIKLLSDKIRILSSTSLNESTDSSMEDLRDPSVDQEQLSIRRQSMPHERFTSDALVRKCLSVVERLDSMVSVGSRGSTASFNIPAELSSQSSISTGIGSMESASLYSDDSDIPVSVSADDIVSVNSELQTLLSYLVPSVLDEDEEMVKLREELEAGRLYLGQLESESSAESSEQLSTLTASPMSQSSGVEQSEYSLSLKQESKCDLSSEYSLAAEPSVSRPSDLNLSVISEPTNSLQSVPSDTLQSDGSVPLRSPKNVSENFGEQNKKSVAESAKWSTNHDEDTSDQAESQNVGDVMTDDDDEEGKILSTYI